MKEAPVFLLVTFWAVLLLGASFGSQSGQAQAQASSGSDGKSAANSAPDGRNDTLGGQKDETSKYSDESRQSFGAVKKGATKSRPIASAKPVPSRRLRSGNTSANNPRTEKPGNTLDSHQSNSAVPSHVATKPLTHSSVPVFPPTVALNGQQFKNARNPGARMASSGGSANSTRGTAVINGSDMKRKP
jgi:hypothetical protein